MQSWAHIIEASISRCPCQLSLARLRSLLTLLCCNMSILPPLLPPGASALARDLQALLECPPEPSPADEGGGEEGRSLGQPIQLGPLPRSLVEDFMLST
jgi:hypothetical protein